MVGSPQWFEEMVDRSLVKTKEQKTVKNIDFSKPVQEVTNGYKNPATVIQEGLTLVRIDDAGGQYQYVAVDETGKTYLCRDNTKFGSAIRIGNVPEEPKDHVQLWKSAYGGDWRLDDGLRTKTVAEAWAAEVLWSRQKRIAVKVPV